MNKFSATLVFTLLICVSALAYGKSKPLADKQMDQISAGSAIANGESTATDSRNFEVDLGGSALNGASAINIVNAVNSTVANGVNVWTGDQTNQGDQKDHAPVTSSQDGNNRNSSASVLQTNTLTQDGVPCDCGTAGKVAAATATRGGEIEIDLATGNAIALDGSTATNKVDESVELSGSAEANAHAINIVNAVGSIVGNGVNVASSMNLSSTSLNQVNVITQSAH